MQLQELAAAAATITTTVTTYQWRKALRRNMARNCSETRLNSSCMAVLLPMNVAAIFSPLHKYITATSSYTTWPTRGVKKVLQVDMLDWKTYQNLYTDMYVSPEHV